ncbi:Uncharacterized protein Adt_34574 [Abeliophyllum distichum]|uniref:Uncharacterized protein n=1 Tax=Abeliophyllum distichum TaxID=126358 RepID=A0ABD1QZG9_9LAMI
MAAELDDGEFWLPPQFLSDDDLLIGGQNKIHPTKRTDDFSFAFGNSFGPFSDLSSPVESVMGSTETESDEDDYMTELTRKIAQSTIQDSAYPFEKQKRMVGFWFSTINSMQCYGKLWVPAGFRPSEPQLRVQGFIPSGCQPERFDTVGFVVCGS